MAQTSEHNPDMRRYEDRDKMLNERLDTMEEEHRRLAIAVTAIGSEINNVRLEQSHLKELFGARLSLIEKSQELFLTKLEQIARDMSDVDKSPMGRTLNGYVRSVQAQVDEHKDSLADIGRWKDQVNGVLLIMKWVGAGGLLALGLSILRLLKMLP